jgi:hypothetical protein
MNSQYLEKQIKFHLNLYATLKRGQLLIKKNITNFVWSLVWSHDFANITVAVMTSFAIKIIFGTGYMLNNLFHILC